MQSTTLLRVFVALFSPILVSAAPSIINGTDVPSASTYPYIVSLFVQNGFNCGGTILSPTLVVTAAHCVHFLRAEDITLRAGSLQFDEGGIGPIILSEIIEHPNYTEQPKTYDYDVAVLKLASPLEFSATISAATLVASNADPVEGTTTTTMGWGRTDPEVDEISPNLKEVDVHVISRSTCQANYQVLNKAVTDRMFCSGEVAGGKDSCQGDSGGPIIDKATGVLVGAVSWGEGCAEPGFPGVYTSFANPELAAFIRAQITPALRSFRRR